MSFSKWACWPIWFGIIRILKKRPQNKSADHQSILSWAQRDAQCESMKLSYQSRGAITLTRLRNFKEMLNQFISVKWVISHWKWYAKVWKENSLRVKYMSLLVIRLISNKCYEDTFYFLSFLLTVFMFLSLALHTCLISLHQIICKIIWLAHSYLKLLTSDEFFITLQARSKVRTSETR